MTCHDADGHGVELRTTVDRTTATVWGEVDLCTAPRFGRRLLRAAHSTRKTLVIDLAETSFLDCAGLAALAGTREALRTENRTLVIQGAQGVVRRAIELSNLTDLLSSEAAPDSRHLPLPG